MNSEWEEAEEEVSLLKTTPSRRGLTLVRVVRYLASFFRRRLGRSFSAPFERTKRCTMTKKGRRNDE